MTTEVSHCITVIIINNNIDNNNIWGAFEVNRLADTKNANFC